MPPGPLPLLRRGLGLVLVLLTLAPFHLVLAPERIGPFGADLRQGADANLQLAWWGILLALVVGAGLALLLPRASVRRVAETVADRLGTISLPLYAAGVGTLAGALGLCVTLIVFRGLPTGVDEMASLLQARYLAEGSLAGPIPEPAAAFMVVNTVLTPEGWLSLYPPSHLLLLAAGLAVDALWLVPSLLLAGLAAGTCVAAHWILGPARRNVARVGSALVALSPFLFFLGGSYLSHVSAAAFLVWAVVAVFAARDGSAGWSVAAGAAIGLAVASRPWTGLVVGGGMAGGLWIGEALRREGSWTWLLRRVAGSVAGGAPVAAAWLLYNRHFFGSPLKLGYSFAYGPTHELGFHRDPWGNLYGWIEALGFTSADLIALGVHLLETPIPAVALVGLWLAIARAVTPGTTVLLAWALLPAVANLFYWHHGFHLGPRMLYEGAPAWVLLTVLAAAGLVRSLTGPGTEAPVERQGPGPDPESRSPGLHSPSSLRKARMRLGEVVSAAFLLCLLVSPFMAISRARTYAWDTETLQRIQIPPVPGREPALVFVHGSWAERVSGRLQASGMRMDSVETALRRNDICQLHRYATRRLEFGTVPADASSQNPVGQELDFRPLPGTPDPLRMVEVTPGNRVRVDPRIEFTPECRREARADRFGVLALAPLLWQGDLPGIEKGQPMAVRDLGPRANARLLARWPERTPYVFLYPGPEASPTLLPYDEGMARLWGEGESRSIGPAGPSAPPGTASAPLPAGRSGSGRPEELVSERVHHVPGAEGRPGPAASPTSPFFEPSRVPGQPAERLRQSLGISRRHEHRPVVQGSPLWRGLRGYHGASRRRPLVHLVRNHTQGLRPGAEDSQADVTGGHPSRQVVRINPVDPGHGRIPRRPTPGLLKLLAPPDHEKLDGLSP